MLHLDDCISTFSIPIVADEEIVSEKDLSSPPGLSCSTQSAQGEKSRESPEKI